MERGSSAYDDTDGLLYTTEGGVATVEFERADSGTSAMPFDVGIRECMNMVNGEGELGECT